MFTSEELATAFPDIYMEPLPFTESLAYSSGNTSESYCEMRWGSKGDFRNSLHFWVVAFHRYFREQYVFPRIDTFKNYDELLNTCAPIVQKELEEGRYALCNPLSFDQFCDALNYYPQRLTQGLELKNRNRYSNAMHMKDEWNDQIILVEYDEEYLFLQWFSSA